MLHALLEGLTYPELRVLVDIVKRLNTEINRIMASPDVRQKMGAMGVEVVQSTPESFAKTLRQDADKYTRLIKELNIQPE